MARSGNAAPLVSLARGHPRDGCANFFRPGELRDASRRGAEHRGGDGDVTFQKPGKDQLDGDSHAHRKDTVGYAKRASLDKNRPQARSGAVAHNPTRDAPSY